MYVPSASCDVKGSLKLGRHFFGNNKVESNNPNTSNSHNIVVGEDRTDSVLVWTKNWDQLVNT